jgi:hypothetical protein
MRIWNFCTETHGTSFRSAATADARNGGGKDDARLTVFPVLVVLRPAGKMLLGWENIGSGARSGQDA